MLRRLYDWTIALAGHKHALWAMAAIAFVESSVFPIPPDVLLIPMVIAAPARAWRVALVCTVASVVGGMAGYAIGYLAFEGLGRPVLDFYGYADRFQDFRDLYNEWGAWAVFLAGITPFPYKVITILSGVTGLNIWVFTVASIAARGIRFFVEAALLWRFGPPIRDFIERRLKLVFTVFAIGLVGGFVVVRFIF